MWSTLQPPHDDVDTISHFTKSKENGYKLWMESFLGSLEWKSVSYDLSMVFKAAIKKS